MTRDMFLSGDSSGAAVPYDLAVVVPVYNEQDSVKQVLMEWYEVLCKLGVNFCIFAYNDGSRDNSAAVLEAVAKEYPGYIRVVNKTNSGHGPTILRGYRETSKVAEWIFQMDSDNEMGPDSFSELWSCRDKYDFLAGTRQGRYQMIPRKIVSFVSRMVIRVFYGKNTIWDVNTPYRLIRSEKFRELFLKIPDDTFAPNLIVSGYVARANLPYKQIGVPHRDRQTGEVSIRKWKLFKASLRAFLQTICFAVRR